jgi:curved DNA-binding protein
MTSKDPYDILGVSRTATADEIKRAYRRLAKETHPDRNPGDKTGALRFKEVRAAYEVLGDPQRRDQYDRFGAGGPAPEFHQWAAGNAGESPFEGIPFDFGSGGDLGSIFEQFFARGSTRSRSKSARRPRQRGPDLEHGVEISLDEVLRGATRDVVLTGGSDGPSERIEVHIPPGVREGQRIRVRGRGQAGPGGRGDLLIRCHIRPHSVFRTEGQDLLLDLPLSFTEATLGAKVEIPTPDGPTVVTVPPGTSSGTKLRLRGRGVPDRRLGTRGDLLAVIRIVAPKTVSPRGRTLLEELDRELDQRPRANWPA